MKICITGCTGSLGSALTERLLAQGHQVVGISRDAGRQLEYLHRFPQVTTHLCDIAEESPSSLARMLDGRLDGCDVVIHAAALKHVPAGELSPHEFMRVNVLGTSNLCKALNLIGSGITAILISTDKAVEPINAYGKCKALAESIWLSEGHDVVRYGNVVDSRGSVIFSWLEATQQGRPIEVRTPEPTRFFLLRADAVDIIMSAIEACLSGKGGGRVLVPAELPAFSLFSLANQFQPPSHWIMRPLGKGEKQHEILIARHEHIADRVNNLAILMQGGDRGEGPSLSSASAPWFMSGKEVMARLIKAGVINPSQLKGLQFNIERTEG